MVSFCLSTSVSGPASISAGDRDLDAPEPEFPPTWSAASAGLALGIFIRLGLPNPPRD